MYDCELPHGTPLFFKGEYKEDSLYPLYIQMFKCVFELKKDHIPTVTMKFGSDFSTNEYLISSGGVEKTLYLTSVDLEMFKKHYDTFDTIEYIGGWKFKGVTGLFDEYIEKWMEVKAQSRKNENSSSTSKITSPPCPPSPPSGCGSAPAPQRAWPAGARPAPPPFQAACLRGRGCKQSSPAASKGAASDRYRRY